MNTYIIEIENTSYDCLVTVTTFNFTKADKEQVKKTTYPDKRKACESLRYRFNDLDFETETLIFNGTKVSSFFELSKLMEKELSDEPVLVSVES